MLWWLSSANLCASRLIWAPGCRLCTHPAFELPDRLPRLCAAHSYLGHVTCTLDSRSQVDTSRPMCEEEGCHKRAYYGYPGSRHARCGPHRLRTMVGMLAIGRMRCSVCDLCLCTQHTVHSMQWWSCSASTASLCNRSSSDADLCMRHGYAAAPTVMARSCVVWRQTRRGRSWPHLWRCLNFLAQTLVQLLAFGARRTLAAGVPAGGVLPGDAARACSGMWRCCVDALGTSYSRFGNVLRHAFDSQPSSNEAGDSSAVS